MNVFSYIMSLLIQLFSEACYEVGVSYWDNVQFYSPYVSFLGVIAFVLAIYFTFKITVGVIRWFFRI